VISSSFRPNGNTILITANTTAPAGVQVTNYSGDGIGQFVYRFVNSGSAPVAIGIGATAGEAQSNAVVPTAGAGNRCLVLLGGSIEVFTLPPGTFLSAICAVGAQAVYVVPGEGI